MSANTRAEEPQLDLLSLDLSTLLENCSALREKATPAASLSERCIGSANHQTAPLPRRAAPHNPPSHCTTHKMLGLALEPNAPGLADAAPPPLSKALSKAPRRRIRPLGDRTNREAVHLDSKPMADKAVVHELAPAERESHDNLLDPLNHTPSTVSADASVRFSQRLEDLIAATSVYKHDQALFYSSLRQIKERLENKQTEAQQLLKSSLPRNLTFFIVGAADFHTNSPLATQKRDHPLDLALQVLRTIVAPFPACTTTLHDDLAGQLLSLSLHSSHLNIVITAIDLLHIVFRYDLKGMQTLLTPTACREVVARLHFADEPRLVAHLSSLLTLGLSLEHNGAEVQRYGGVKCLILKMTDCLQQDQLETTRHHVMQSLLNALASLVWRNAAGQAQLLRGHGRDVLLNYLRDREMGSAMTIVQVLTLLAHLSRQDASHANALMDAGVLRALSTLLNVAEALSPTILGYLTRCLTAPDHAVRLAAANHVRSLCKTLRLFINASQALNSFVALRALMWFGACQLQHKMVKALLSVLRELREEQPDVAAHVLEALAHLFREHPKAERLLSQPKLWSMLQQVAQRHAERHDVLCALASVYVALVRHGKDMEVGEAQRVLSFCNDVLLRLHETSGGEGSRLARACMEILAHCADHDHLLMAMRTDGEWLASAEHE
ncbi:uncharacterized protein MONBRDRAFT_22379 [Monosiga brevicollis MX1]|uniref:Uncharacterized protein n=1 Tax=Monosiga brevicollis TaxID=81824 RepID=A9UQE6_MONBE|nr:uncharacterized protein MONBRDRAFT_22379 [Monosiga brevicollis MX1]EDQ92585.1 predicted protein [Monosiga brevicollis MX1]|eukprot:XP_001742347.1 hypothetical protein [Monosiga brevicollis MX1]